MMEGGEAFFLPGSRSEGVLLIHGLTGSPSEMRLLGEYLNREGYAVLAPRLTGHATQVAELSRTNWPLWYGSAVDGYHLLAGYCSRIHLAGLSMGGLLSLKLSREFPAAKVVSLSAPIVINDPRLPFLPFYRLFRRYAIKRPKPMPGVDSRYMVNYDRTPLSCVASLQDLIREVSALLPDIVTPLLVAQSRAEHTVKPQSAQYIYERAGSREKELLWLEKSGHRITLDVEKELLFSRILDFLRR